MTKTTKLNGTDLGLPLGPGSFMPGPVMPSPSVPSGHKKQQKLDPVEQKCYQECNDLCYFQGATLKQCKEGCDKICLKNKGQIDKELIKTIESQIEKDMCKKYSGEEECLNDCFDLIQPSKRTPGIVNPPTLLGQSKKFPMASMCENVCDKINTLCKPSGSVIVYPDTSSTGLSVGSIVVIVSLSLLLLILIFMVMTGRIKL